MSGPKKAFAGECPRRSCGERVRSFITDGRIGSIFEPCPKCGARTTLFRVKLLDGARFTTARASDRLDLPIHVLDRTTNDTVAKAESLDVAEEVAKALNRSPGKARKHSPGKTPGKPNRTN
jgi:hypothetical protein